jgi:hypothetical protein
MEQLISRLRPLLGHVRMGSRTMLRNVRFDVLSRIMGFAVCVPWLLAAVGADK